MTRISASQHTFNSFNRIVIITAPNRSFLPHADQNLLRVRNSLIVSERAIGPKMCVRECGRGKPLAFIGSLFTIMHARVHRAPTICCCAHTGEWRTNTTHILLYRYMHAPRLSVCGASQFPWHSLCSTKCYNFHF